MNPDNIPWNREEIFLDDVGNFPLYHCLPIPEGAETDTDKEYIPVDRQNGQH